MSTCTVIRSGDSYAGRQGLADGAGVSAESSRARGICMLRLTMPPGARARAHLHEDRESSIYVIAGRGECAAAPAAAGAVTRAGGRRG
ncbi:MAG TPA: hypothetical protein VN213_22285 [Solirubrobacteraceae bacterium]|nr:hypothetical protein [Solirubrobacteraceae bacterium]